MNPALFPKNFLWGASTSSYQIEGAVAEGGRAPSIWDTFCRTGGKVANGDTGDRACDHYHLFADDVQLMRAIGLNSYRFSFAWPRIQPHGHGPANEAGLEFYDRLIDALLENGIKPNATCFHWDLPQALEDKGGWRLRETAEHFGEYVSILAQRFGDRIPLWATLNEPWVFWWMGHHDGTHAPGARERGKTIWQISHHILLAHGLGMQALRANLPESAWKGIVYNTFDCIPFAETPEHIAAARKRYEDLNGWLTGSVVNGEYPASHLERLGPDAPDVAPGDMEIISTPLDFAGLNIYRAPGLIHAERGHIQPEPWFPRTDFNWPITSECLYWGIRFFQETFGRIPLMITENGCCYPDEPDENGRVEDPARIEYLKTYIGGVQRAVSEGYDLRGYFVWSLMDNFEWAAGYTKRFGLTHVDFETLERTPKASAEWYSLQIKAWSEAHGVPFNGTLAQGPAAATQ